jgi:ABC-type sugar transport system substrate-binding protein
MSRTIRIGILIAPGDPFWAQVHEVIWQRAQTLAVELIEITIEESHLLSSDEQVEVVEDLIAQELDALICNVYPPTLLARILDGGIPIIYVAEIALRHPRFTSHIGLYDAGYMLGKFLHERLAGCGTLLVVGGHMDDGEDNGQSRLDGFFAALPSGQHHAIHHVPSKWSHEDATHHLTAYLGEHADLRVDAIFGLSDSIAIAARDVCQSLGRIDSDTLILGINGDPLALSSIANDRMTATVETDIDDLATKVVDLAYRAACGDPLPPYFRNRQHLVTADNVAEVAMQKLLSLATLPTRPGTPASAYPSRGRTPRPRPSRRRWPRRSPAPEPSSRTRLTISPTHAVRPYICSTATARASRSATSMVTRGWICCSPT